MKASFLKRFTASLLFVMMLTGGMPPAAHADAGVSNDLGTIMLFIEDGEISLYGNAEKTIDYEQGEMSGTANSVTLTNRDVLSPSSNSIIVDAEDGDVELTIMDLNIVGGNIYVMGNVSIELDGISTITGPSNEPGIFVSNHDNHLVIEDKDENGTLNVTGGPKASGIGGFSGSYYSWAPTHGDITINGGTITATAGEGGAAGIGSAYKGALGEDEEPPTITINGGNVTATGAVGIGGSRSSAAGNININGGIVVAYGNDGGGIGGGSFTTVGNVTITGGNVTVSAQYESAIGGDGAFGGTVNIVGGTVKVTGGSSPYVANNGQKLPDIGA